MNTDQLLHFHQIGRNALSETSAKLEYFGISARLYRNNARRIVARFHDMDTGGNFIATREYDDVEDAFLSFPGMASHLCDEREAVREMHRDTGEPEYLDERC